VKDDDHSGGMTWSMQYSTATIYSVKYAGANSRSTISSDLEGKDK